MAVEGLQQCEGCAGYPSSLGARHVMGKAYLVPPKTNAGRRVIPLPESLAAELGLYIKGTGRVKPDDLVFVQEDGAPLNRMIETRAWKKALQRVGLPGISCRIRPGIRRRRRWPSWE